MFADLENLLWRVQCYHNWQKRKIMEIRPIIQQVVINWNYYQWDTFKSVEVNCASVWVHFIKHCRHAGHGKTSRWFPAASHKLPDEQLLCFCGPWRTKSSQHGIFCGERLQKLVGSAQSALQSRYKAAFDNTVREKMRRLPGGLGIEVFSFFFSPPPPPLPCSSSHSGPSGGRWFRAAE